MAGNWTYDPAALATSKTYQVRRLIGDVLPSDQQMYDEEIAYLITINPGSIYRAAAECARTIAAQFARKVDIVEQDKRTAYSAQARNYKMMADALDKLANIKSGGIPYAGAVSQMDKLSQVLNGDRVPPQFNIGMQDNLIPVGPVGNETPGSPPRSGQT